MAPKKNPPGGRFAELRAEVDNTPYVLTPEIKIYPMSRQQMVDYLAAAAAPGNKQQEIRNRAMFGDQFEAIQELFATEPNAVWTLFVKDMNTFLFGQKADDAPGGSKDSSSG